MSTTRLPSWLPEDFTDWHAGAVGVVKRLLLGFAAGIGVMAVAVWHAERIDAWVEENWPQG